MVLQIRIARLARALHASAVVRLGGEPGERSPDEAEADAREVLFAGCPAAVVAPRAAVVDERNGLQDRASISHHSLSFRSDSVVLDVV